MESFVKTTEERVMDVAPSRLPGTKMIHSINRSIVKGSSVSVEYQPIDNDKVYPSNGSAEINFNISSGRDSEMLNLSKSYIKAKVRLLRKTAVAQFTWDGTKYATASTVSNYLIGTLGTGAPAAGQADADAYKAWAAANFCSLPSHNLVKKVEVSLMGDNSRQFDVADRSNVLSELSLSVVPNSFFDEIAQKFAIGIRSVGTDKVPDNNDEKIKNLHYFLPKSTTIHNFPSKLGAPVILATASDFLSCPEYIPLKRMPLNIKLSIESFNRAAWIGGTDFADATKGLGGFEIYDVKFVAHTVDLTPELTGIFLQKWMSDGISYNITRNFVYSQQIPSGTNYFNYTIPNNSLQSVKKILICFTANASENLATANSFHFTDGAEASKTLSDDYTGLVSWQIFAGSESYPRKSAPLQVGPRNYLDSKLYSEQVFLENNSLLFDPQSPATRFYESEIGGNYQSCVNNLFYIGYNFSEESKPLSGLNLRNSSMKIDLNFNNLATTLMMRVFLFADCDIVYDPAGDLFVTNF